MAPNTDHKKLQAAVNKDNHLVLQFNFELIENSKEVGVYSLTSIQKERDELETSIGKKPVEILQQIECIPGVHWVSISRRQISVCKYVPERWNDLKPQILAILAKFYPGIAVVEPE